MELTESNSRITHKRIGRTEVPRSDADFKGQRYDADIKLPGFTSGPRTMQAPWTNARRLHGAVW